MIGWFTRASIPRRRFPEAGGYADQSLAGIEANVRGDRLAIEATGVVQSCANLWEMAGRGAEIRSQSALVDRPLLAYLFRSLALRGEFLAAIRDDVLAPLTAWDTVTRGGRPVAFRGQVVESQGNAPYETLLAGEAVHALINPMIETPWMGQSPLRGANLSAKLVTTIEKALLNNWSGPVGSKILPHPELNDEKLNELQRATNPTLAPRQGATLFAKAVRLLSGTSPTPMQDWEAKSVSPDISGLGDHVAQHEAVADSIRSAYGIPPGIFGRSTPGNSIRESLRHMSFATLQPIADMLGDELSAKLGSAVEIDVVSAFGVSDFVARARALATIAGIEGEIPESRLRLLKMS